MGQLPCGPRRSGFSVLATRTQPTLQGPAVAPPAVVLDPANAQRPSVKKGSENVVTQGHVMAHTSLFVTASVTMLTALGRGGRQGPAGPDVMFGFR